LGYNTNFKYKNLDVSLQLYAALGQKIVRNYERQQPYANMLDYNIRRWTGPGSTNEYARLGTDLNRNSVFSDFYVEDGSFLRLRNVQIGYNLPAEKAGRLHMQGLRVYLSGNNLFTLTNYMGFDPDIGSAGGALASGVDYGFYPQARNLMLGFNLRF
jgi:hypothetical protein